MADKPVSAARGNNRAADGSADPTIISKNYFDFEKAGNMANYFQTAALKSGQSAARLAK